jgi:hypothetical protein
MEKNGLLMVYLDMHVRGGKNEIIMKKNKLIVKHYK